MGAGYGQFCPVAKATEVFATRWTPLVLRELMSGERTFNDIHRGVPLMSRALLAERLRQLEENGLLERRGRPDGTGHDYVLTRAGDALRPIVDQLGRWGLVHGRDRLAPAENDPLVLMWGLRRRVDRAALPPRRVTVRFEFSALPANRTRMRLWWLVLERRDVDVCRKDPGFPVDVTVAGRIDALVQVYLGHKTWPEVAGRALKIDGEREVTRSLASWLRLDQVIGRDLPVVPLTAS
ncbi:MAG: helix-turn-helix transcriptional regulator [Alphaproteobacteria bacterium]|nr:helix-turn-helix transcriptional regulator [Alphaproteobacteria bacterium]